ncbi:unnamed protein product [Prunus brigantina]
MGGSVEDVQFKELDNAVWPSGCEASKHMDEVEAEEQPEPFSVSDVQYSAFMKDGTSEGADPSSLANKVAWSAPAPASLETVQELAKETGSSEEQNQAQNGLDDALKRRLQKLIDSNRVMLFMKGTPEEPKCEFSRMAVTLLKYYEVEFGSFDLLTDNEVTEGIQKYSNWPHLPQIYFEGRARGFRHIETLMKDIKVKEPKTTELIAEDEELMDEDEDEDEELIDEEEINEIKTFLILHRGPPSPTESKAEESKAEESEGEEFEGEESEGEELTPEEIGECMYCLKVGEHITQLCPYQHHVPKNATLGEGCELICKICGCRFIGSCCADCGLSEGCAILKRCLLCGKLGDHWLSMCPKREGKHIPSAFTCNDYNGYFTFNPRALK